MQGLPPIALRGMRVEQAVALQEPDRVPFIPTWNNFYQLEYGVSFGESMRDPFTLNAALDHVLDRYEPDLVYMPTVFPSPFGKCEFESFIILVIADTRESTVPAVSVSVCFSSCVRFCISFLIFAIDFII